jgi:hypothetical protein
MLPEGGMEDEDEESHDKGEVDVIQQDDGENGRHLHGPRERKGGTLRGRARVAK